MSQLAKMYRLFDTYTELVGKNPDTVRNVESGLRMLSYLVPDSVLSEMLYTTSSLLTMLHDSMYRKIADIKWKMPVPHGQLMTWLKVLEQVEVFLELAASSLPSSTLCWFIIVCIHIAKAAVRFMLLLKYNSNIQVSPLLPPLNRSEYKVHLRKRASSLNGVDSSSSMTDVAPVTSPMATFTLTRSGRTVRSIAAAPPTSERCWKVPTPQAMSGEGHDMDHQPTQLTQKQLVGEALYIARPLAHLFSLYVFGLKSWKPWLLSAAVDASSLLLHGNSCTLNPTEQMELRRRALLMVLYLLRSPFYDRWTRMRLFFLLKLVENNIPVSGFIMKMLANYIPLWQRTYFYVWMS